MSKRQRDGGPTTLTTHIVINGYPVWVFLDDPNVARHGEWMVYEAGTYLIIAVGGGGNGGTGTSSSTNGYCNGDYTACVGERVSNLP